jgi:rare lipoprotein A
MQKGSKRILTILMLAAVPLVSAEPVSTTQDLPVPPRISPVSAPPAPPLRVKKARPAKIFYGIASWYSETDPGINKHTANGEVFEDTKLTCASWDFAFGTQLKVTNMENGKSVVCRVNDRGPAKRLHRVIDLTQTAFRRIANPKKGLVWVSVTPVPS